MSLDITAAQTIWSEAGVILRRRLGEGRFSLWLKRSRIVQVEGNLFSIGLPNIFIVTMVNDILKKEIKEVLKSLVGEEVEIRFVVDAELFREHRKIEEDVSKARREAEDWGQEYSLPLDKRFRLDNFAAGEVNKFVYDCAVSTVNALCSCGNPLVFYGLSETGKTHILLAIANASIEKNPSLRVVYTTPDAFAKSFSRALKNDDLVRFRTAMRTSDVFILDDADSLTENEKLKDEFLYTIEQHLHSGSQVISAFARHPEIALANSKRLRARFLSGMLVPVLPPDKAARRQIAQQVFDRLPETGRHLLAQEIADFIATNFRGSASSVLSAARQIAAYITVEAVGQNEFVSLEKASALLSGIIKTQDRETILSSLCETLSEKFNITEEELRSGSRKRYLSSARNLFFYLAKTLCGLSFSELGGYMNRTHTAAHRSFKQIEKELPSNPKLDALVKEILNKLKR
ncbi:MAG: DnaA/Hda family protein [Planctomycetota bacterium]|nr:DnaA/Hda family protein [Planctomycetota bacterium]